MLHAPSIRSIEMVLALEYSDNKNKYKESKRKKNFETVINSIGRNLNTFLISFF